MDNLIELEPFFEARKQIPARINTAINRLISHVDTLNTITQQLDEADTESLRDFQNIFEQDYREARLQLLDAGRFRTLNMRAVEDITQHLSVLKRVIKQYRKAVETILTVIHMPPLADTIPKPLTVTTDTSA